MRRGLTLAEIILLLLLVALCGGVFYILPPMPTRSTGLPGEAAGFLRGLSEGALLIVNLMHRVLDPEHPIFTLNASRGYDLGFLLGGALFAPVVCNPLLLRVQLSLPGFRLGAWAGPLIGLLISAACIGGFFFAGLGHPTPCTVADAGQGAVAGLLHGLMSPLSLVWSVFSPTTSVYQGGNGLGYDIAFCLPELCIWVAGFARLLPSRAGAGKT